ncbi:uncharacterized protein LOC131148402 [Malania oleifera]|uniref:uncharacterized protein LOC131148402 n=1 Tax=Malania oleifera TaxID=397392 RepID=UPI0025AE547D|nr:uncharacterized protein LOC131148402 [Malania oleifera]
MALKGKMEAKEALTVEDLEAADMPGIDPAVIEHRLQVNPNHRPMKQKKRSFAMERIKIINEEVTKLLQANFIREVDYPEWLSNMVLVRKPNGKWRTCIDFTDLNKACPKDSFPLPRIDQLRPESSGRMTRWSIELSEFDIQYQPRPAVKAQVLADFTAERLPESSTKSEEWTLHVDGSSNASGGGAGFIVSDLEGNETLFAIKLEFIATNNEAEYEALLAGLRLAEALGVAQIKVLSDS